MIDLVYYQYIKLLSRSRFVISNLHLRIYISNFLKPIYSIMIEYQSQSINPKINFYSLFKQSTGLALAAFKA